jgi:HEPN superfamily protein
MTVITCATRTDELLAAAARDLELAEIASRPTDRYAAAHLAALRAAAAVLAERSGSPDTWAPTCGARGAGANAAGALSRRRAPASAWDQLREAAPELGEWASHFAAGAAKRAAAAAGLSRSVCAEEADALLADSAAFLKLVRALVR